MLAKRRCLAEAKHQEPFRVLAPALSQRAQVSSMNAQPIAARAIDALPPVPPSPRPPTKTTLGLASKKPESSHFALRAPVWAQLDRRLELHGALAKGLSGLRPDPKRDPWPRVGIRFASRGERRRVAILCNKYRYGLDTFGPSPSQTRRSPVPRPHTSANPIRSVVRGGSPPSRQGAQAPSL